MKRTGFAPKSYEERIKKAQVAQKRRLERQRSAPQKKKTRKTTKASKLRRKRGEWSTKTADTYFSIEIRDRDGKCLRCGAKDNLSCSHYHRRGHSATRYDFDNCIALCYGPNSNKCHETWEGPKAEYTEFMIKRLGVEKFAELAVKAGTMVKRSDAVAEYKQYYKERV